MTSIVKWLANGRLTIEAMSPELVVSYKLSVVRILATDCIAGYMIVQLATVYLLLQLLYVCNTDVYSNRVCINVH